MASRLGDGQDCVLQPEIRDALCQSIAQRAIRVRCRAATIGRCDSPADNRLPQREARVMGGRDRASLEVGLLSDLLAHADGRADEFDARLVALQRRCGVEGPVGAVAAVRQEAESLYRDIRRLSAAMALTQAYMEVRREQLAQLREAAERDNATTMEV